tara:strand:- start:20 stop:277 length:258 start_codon:yes stop_codon:yes gene_type:complete
MEPIKIRCRACGKELIGHPSRSVTCGCSNMTTIRGDKISAVDLEQIVMVSNAPIKTKPKFLSQSDIEWQEARRKRKVRKLDFEVR